MKILLINHYAGSPEMGMEFRPYYFAREWIKMGHEVVIVAGNYSHLRKENPVIKADFEMTMVDGIQYVWIKTGRYCGNGAKRAISMFGFTGKLWLHAKMISKKYAPDVVITSSTYPIDTFAGKKIAKYAKSALVHEVHDMWPATLYEVGGMSRRHPFVQIMQIGENSAYKHSDKVVSLLPLAKEYMIQHGMREDKYVHIPNGVVLEEWVQPLELPKTHKEILQGLRKQEKFIVGYFGGHAISNNLDTLIDTAKITDNKQIHYVLVGNGVEKKHLVERCEQEGIENVTFLDPILKLAVPELVKYFDCIYIGTKKSPLYRFGICSNKVYDSMMAGRPIVGAIDVEECEIVQYHCGYMAKADDVQDILNKIMKVYQLSVEEREDMGDNGRKAVKEMFNYKYLANKYMNTIKESIR